MSHRTILLGLISIMMVVSTSASWVSAQTEELQIRPEASPSPTAAPEEFYRGRIVGITSERRDAIGIGGTQPWIQTVVVKFLEGPRRDEEVTLEFATIVEKQKLTVGQKVVLVTPADQPYIFDRYRLPALGAILGLFAAIAVLFAGWRGLASLVGLGVSIGILAAYVVPAIMAGRNPLLVSLLGSVGIATISMYLAHGVRRRTTVALGSTLLTIVIALVLAEGFVRFALLTGTGSEEAYYLQTSPVNFVNLTGLLLGGIIIGALGVLDDITTSQAAIVEEMWRANPTLSRGEVFRRSFSVGREHITSLINTLALAYVGASLPALLLFVIYQRPWWVVANTETIAEEIIRTLVGSIALMCAVPLTTWLATIFLSHPRAPQSAHTIPPATPHHH